MNLRPATARSDAAIRRVWRLPAADAVRGWRALWWSVGPAGELAVLLVHRRHLSRSRYVKGWIGWRPEAPFSGELVTVTAQGERRTPLENIPLRPGHLVLLPESRFLMAAGRTFRSKTSTTSKTEEGATEGPWTPNAVVFSPSGTPEAEFCIGDDLSTLLADRHGGIWATYGDEGIYGGHPESAAGMAGWNAEGRAIWAPEGRLPSYPLDGCAAATEGERVWLVWYSGGGHGAGTYLTRITPSTGEVTSYRSPVPQPDGFAVRGHRAVMTVRNHHQRSVELIRAELEGATGTAGTTWTVTSRRKLRVPGRVVLYCGQGRDGYLWLRTGDTWLRIEA
ncbi:hypothetical protein [Streptomyces sp. NPDC059649]|uniref:hypothetical protein n=1 Tax=Streptomyces sp. NPDC059649 TaxID=3346895 RepID=UPI0036A987FA